MSPASSWRRLSLALALSTLLAVAVAAAQSRNSASYSSEEIGKAITNWEAEVSSNVELDVDSYYMQYLYKYKMWETLTTHGVQVGVNCTCNLHPKISGVLEEFKICNAPLVPSWILAVIIGLFSGYKFHSLGPSVVGSLSYSISFVMYAVMISSGLIVHCLFLIECGAGSANAVYIDVARIDASLTSCIAISFLFNALVDSRLLPEREFGTLVVMLVTYVWVFYAYFAQLVSPMLLYFATVVVCCGLYVVFQFALTIRNHCHALGYLLAAGAVGGASMWLFKDRYCWLCQTFGAWSVEGVWYYGSDVAMLLVALYAWNTRRSQSSCCISKEASTTTKDSSLKRQRIFNV